MAPGFVIGLTGGMWTGKTTVARILAGLGCTIIDADQIGHQLLTPGTEVYRKVRAEFGATVVGPDGWIDRSALGKIVFAHPEARRRLNQLMHPAIIAQIEAAIGELKANGADGVVEIPLLFEAGLENKAALSLDEIWVVAAAPAVQLARVMARNGLAEKEAERRIDAQMPLREKIDRADLVIYNDGTEAELKEKVVTHWVARKQAHISRFGA
jgi:dephospho-CoA kinase